MTDNHSVGTFTGIYYISYTLAAILGPNINGWLVQLSGGSYNLVMLASVFFFIIALGFMLGVRRGEARPAADHLSFSAQALPESPNE